ncbi:UNVERIFIED_CONTAM: hypothetical protein GTU68_027387 [Idotea baltica]|nr:hypothetical protein [Idotea baltica]
MRPAARGDDSFPKPRQQSQGPLAFAIIDEVDNILIDEARTPLIISGPAHQNPARYAEANRIATELTKDVHYQVNEKDHTATLTDEGVRYAEKLAGVESFYTAGNMDWPHMIDNALKAHGLYKIDVNYVIKDGGIVIVDEFTGRLMEGRQWSDGLHQAVEAKEGLKIKEETQTLATVTLQNYFKLYEKICGMTGTALTEAEELYKIYELDVVAIPTNREMQRIAHPDIIYSSEKFKWMAIADEVENYNRCGRPVLVGTVSIEKSEIISRLLDQRGVKHEVLNAKNHKREAEIVAQAGRRGAVTIATNMAGRGTDIVMGVEVLALGGLHVIGTERHDARRIDLQLRGRCGRQGDAGSSRFFLSLDDDLMRIFAGPAVKRILEMGGFKDDVPIENKMVSRRIGAAQKKREEYNFEIRKSLLEYDEVMDEQRKRIYRFRQRILDGQSCREIVQDMVRDQIESNVSTFLDSDFGTETFASYAGSQLMVTLDPKMYRKLTPEEIEYDLPIEKIEKLEQDELEQTLEAVVENHYHPEFRRMERMVLLEIVDSAWKDHLLAMDYLRSAVGQRGMAQLDPKVEYKREGMRMFDGLWTSIGERVTDLVFRMEQLNEAFVSNTLTETTAIHEDAGSVPMPQEDGGNESDERQDAADRSGRKQQKVEPIRNREEKVGRNDPCPCGSGKKYKSCCMRR